MLLGLYLLIVLLCLLIIFWRHVSRTRPSIIVSGIFEKAIWVSAEMLRAVFRPLGRPYLGYVSGSVNPDTPSLCRYEQSGWNLDLSNSLQRENVGCSLQKQLRNKSTLKTSVPPMFNTPNIDWYSLLITIVVIARFQRELGGKQRKRRKLNEEDTGTD